MRRVFIQAYCGYPHGGALANYVENVAKTIVYAGYEAVLVTDTGKEYDGCSDMASWSFVHVRPVMPSEDGEVLLRQKKTGYCKERLGVLEEFEITGADRVIVLGLRNEFFLEKLFEYRDKVGFKVICGVLELFTKESYAAPAQYQDYLHIRDEVYLRADAILTVSSYIVQYYARKGMMTYLLPPVIDYPCFEMKSKDMDKYRFIIPSKKDSLKAMIEAFCRLKEEETSRLELHLCMVKKETVRAITEEAKWQRFMQFAVIHEWMSYQELIDLYQRMHFLVIARDVSQRTLANFPSKVPECMALGIVPVVSDVGDYTKFYLSNGEDSILMDRDAVEEIESAVKSALSLSEEAYKRYSENARKTAKERFDCHVWVGKVQEMLEGENREQTVFEGRRRTER